jgi:putative oxidoreductase
MGDLLPWLLSTETSPDAHASGALVLRVSVGLLLLRHHGWHKLADALAWRRGATREWPFVSEIREAGFPAPLASAVFATLAQLLGSACLVAGLLARPAALLLAATLLGAVYTNLILKKSNQLALLYLGAVLAVALLGAGPWSLDAALFAPAP